MSDQSLRDALISHWDENCDGVDWLAGTPEEYASEAIRFLAAHPAEPAPVVTDLAVEAVARVEYGFGWDMETPGVQSVCRDMARKALEAAAPLLGPRPLLDREAVREKIADWYSAHYNPDHDVFYETDDRGVQPDEDENAMHAYRGFEWAQELVRTMPTREQIAKALHDHSWPECAADEESCLNLHFMLQADVVLALLNGAVS